MRKLSLFLLLSFLILTGIFFSIPVKKDQKFIKIPVSFFPRKDRPVMKVKIEGKNYRLLIDTGSSRTFGLQTRYLNTIKRKQSLPDTQYFDIKGIGHPSMRFKIPNVNIGHLTIHNVPILENTIESLMSSKIHPSSGLWDSFVDYLELKTVHGSIGWSILKEFDCLFDFPNRQLIIAQSMSSMINDAKCSFDDYIEIPFQLTKSGICLKIETDQGTQNAMLDTGATHSVMRPFKDYEKTYETKTLIIGEKDLGLWKFLVFDFSKDFECDCILGIDFFKTHSICFDFHNNLAYIKPYSSRKFFL